MYFEKNSKKEKKVLQCAPVSPILFLLGLALQRGKKEKTGQQTKNTLFHACIGSSPYSDAILLIIAMW